MSSTLINGIGELVTCDGTGSDLLGVRSKTALVVEDDKIAWIGAATETPPADTMIDVDGRAVIPGFVDSHSHLVFAGDRAGEFVARMTGQPYDGGGIGVTMAATRAASDAELARLVEARIAELRALGTTTIEIKSGYGLTVTDEVRALRIARQFTSETTFLGAHVVPAEYAYDRAAYVDLITGPMLRRQRRTRAGSMSSASRTRPTPLTRMKRAKSSKPEQRLVLAYGSMATSSVPAQVFSWPSS